MREPYDEEILNSIVGRLINRQDSAIIQAIYEGIRGLNCYELIELRKEDVKGITPDNKLTLRSVDREGRVTLKTIEISEKLKLLLNIASEETTYLRRNGEDIKDAVKLVDSPYVFRPTVLTTFHGVEVHALEKVSEADIVRTIHFSSEWFGLPDFNIINIYNPPREV